MHCIGITFALKTLFHQTIQEWSTVVTVSKHFVIVHMKLMRYVDAKTLTGALWERKDLCLECKTCNDLYTAVVRIILHSSLGEDKILVNYRKKSFESYLIPYHTIPYHARIKSNESYLICCFLHLWTLINNQMVAFLMDHTGAYWHIETKLRKVRDPACNGDVL